MNDTMLEVRNLHVDFPIRQRNGSLVHVHSLNGVTFTMKQGEILGVVGESGCGKSTLARTILCLERKLSGEVLFRDKPVFEKNAKELRNFRREAQIVFQDPFSALNRRKTIQSLLKQPLRIHGMDADAQSTIATMLHEVGLKPEVMNRYPHQFSGGQRQRVAIARSLILKPKLLICDEAVSALDLSVQAQIINLMLDLREKHDLTYLFIAHDLSVIEFMSDRILVLYLGRIVELIKKQDLRTKAKHPYTQALLAVSEQTGRQSPEVPRGEVPSPINLPTGCFFASRCPFVTERCRQEYPPLREHEDGHQVACWLYE